MNVVVTGASGFIGSHLVDALLESGHSVRALARHLPGLLSKSALCNPNLSVHTVDICNRLDLERVLTSADVVFHLACSSLPQTSNRNIQDDVSTNLIGSINLLEASRRADVSRFIFLSSGGTVYGVPRQIPILESHPTNPICSYGITKLAIEKYIFLYNKLYGLDGFVLRVSNPYGERQRMQSCQGVIPVFLGRLLRSESLDVWGDGRVVRDYIYISDLICALLSVLNYQGQERLFNIGSGVGLSINDLICHINVMVQRPIKINYLEGRPFDVSSNILSIDKAIHHLSWLPKVSISEGLSKFYLSLM